MMMRFPFTAGALALALAASPAAAQHEGHGPPPDAGVARPDDPEAAEPAPAGPHPHALTGALGSYPTTREASGTAWQPDSTPHSGVHVSAGDWALMGHATLFGVYDWQGGPRGGEKAFLSGMVMGMARRPIGPGIVQLRASLSPD